MENSLLIAVTEISAKLSPELPILERIKVAMKEAMKHWLVTDENSQFRCAVAAVMEKSSNEEKAILKEELEFMQLLGAATRGVPVDVLEWFASRDPKKWYHLQDMWRTLKKEAES